MKYCKKCDGTGSVTEIKFYGTWYDFSILKNVFIL